MSATSRDDVGGAAGHGSIDYKMSVSIVADYCHTC